MKSERGITLSTLMVYLVAMAMVIITVTNITRYFYANVTHTENTTEYAEDYLKLSVYLTEEVNEKDNIILQNGEDKENETVIQKYVIFSKSYNQYTFKPEEKAIYKNQEKICDNIKNCVFTPSPDNTKLTVNITMEDDKQYNTTYTIRNY